MIEQPMNERHPLRYGYRVVQVLNFLAYYFGYSNTSLTDNAKIGGCKLLYSIIRVAAGLEPLYMTKKYGYYPDKPIYIERMKKILDEDENLFLFKSKCLEMINFQNVTN